ncbi:MAG: hypothetical protein QXN96_04185 [Candidatus Bathyarchaeia archaeon]
MNNEGGPEEFQEDMLDTSIPESNKSKRVDISKSFSGTLSNKLRILSEAVEEIDQLIELRKSLSKVIQERIEREISNSEYLLSQVKPWQLGTSHSIEMRRLGLEKEILSLRKEKRSEEVRCWEHIASLKKLRRQFVIEYQNLLNTKNILEGSAP